MDLDRLFAIPVAATFAAGWGISNALSLPPLSPLVTAPLTWALTAAPDNVRVPLVSRLSKYLSQRAIQNGTTMLKVLLGLGIARQLHLALSDLAQNNMRLRSEKSRYNWPQEIVLITGAAGGFGSLLCKDFAAQGLTVIAVDVVESMPANLKGYNKIYYYKCDITTRDAVMELAERVRSEHGNPSILVNNAGVGFNHPLLGASENAVLRTYEVNVISHHWTIQAFLPAMIEAKKGHIVTVASMASFIGAGSIGAYSGSKAAAVAFHESLRQELREFYNAPEIKTTIVHPTFAATAMTAKFKDELEGKATIIDPKMVTDAIFKQVMSCKGAQIILPGSLTMIPTVLRSLPHWLHYAVVRAGEGAIATKMDPERSAT